MSSRPDQHVVPGTLPLGEVSPSRRCQPTGLPGEDGRERGYQVTVNVDLDPPLPVVSVVGVLERSGGALLTAVLEYVREQDGRPVAVDLRGVSHVDRYGLAPITRFGVAIAGTSPAVDQALAHAMRRSRDMEDRAGTARTPRLPDPARPYGIHRPPPRRAPHPL